MQLLDGLLQEIQQEPCGIFANHTSTRF